MPEANHQPLPHALAEIRRFVDQIIRPLVELTHQGVDYLRHNPEFIESLRYWMTDAPADLKRAFGDAGYLIPEEMSMGDVAVVLRAYQDGGAQAAKDTIRRFYDELFRDPEYLGRLEERWEGHEHSAFSRRIHILRQALAAHRAGLWGAVVPTLLSQAEGIVADLAEHTGQLRTKRYKRLLLELPEDHQILAGIVRGFVDGHLLVGFNHGDPVPEFSRHAILHGADTAFATEHHSQRAILLIDYLCWLDPDIVAAAQLTRTHPRPSVDSGV